MYTEEEFEKFGITDGSGEIVVDRTALKKDFIKRGVSLLVQQESLKEEIKSVMKEVKEKEYDTKEVGALIKHAYKNSIEAQIEELQEIQTTLDNLFGGQDVV